MGVLLPIKDFNVFRAILLKLRNNYLQDHLSMIPSKTTKTISLYVYVYVLEAVNYYHKAFHLICCSSPRSASVC